MPTPNTSVRVSTCIAVTILFAGCGNKTDTKPEEINEMPSVAVSEDMGGVTDGRLVISALPKISEPNACILPITVRNGTEATTTISMMQFTITGSGEDDSGNMFAQTVEPGETNTARLLFPTRQCEDLQLIIAPNLTCRSGELDCVDMVEFEATSELAFERIVSD